MTPDEVKKIWEDVKKNQAKLRGCPGPHDFEDMNPNEAIRKKYRCRLCGGEIDGSKYYWYAMGLEHGRSHPDGT